jgi:glycine/D-amino acid oxidase-like deaminating enzyme
VVLRGLTTMVPGLAAYHQHARRPSLDGGYYVKTRENRLLAGPLPVQGAYIIGALSGYGLMAASGAAELLADYLTGTPLPDYASAFSLARYSDPAYQARLTNWNDTGQL